MKTPLLWLALLTIAVFTNSPVFAQNCYELVWSDEFNYAGLPDSTKWTFETGGGGWGNNELQYYTKNRTENARVQNGKLIIEARKENYENRQYTSARLITYPNNHSWQYGRVEASIKLPYGQGIWPAFWMLGNGIFENTAWPACGEIDIMEMVGGGAGRDNKTHGTLHWSDANNNHAYYGGAYQLSSGILADTFHVFAIEWDQYQIRWFIDTIQFHVIDITPAHLSEIHNKFFILLNIAVGGNWPGNPDATTVFPQQMAVDYVRVYQKNATPQINGDTSIIKQQKNVIYSVPESPNFSYQWGVPAGAQIIDGQGTNKITVNWGCDNGFVQCTPTTTCNTYSLKKQVTIKPVTINGADKIAENSVNNRYSVVQAANVTYTWSAPHDAQFIGRTDTNVVYINWGTTPGIIKVIIDGNCGTDSALLNIAINKQLPYPNPLQPHAIPGTIMAVNYDSGGEGIAYHDTDAENKGTGQRQDEGVDTEPNDGGENIGWVMPGEWLEYTVNVTEPGPFNLAIRTASQNGGGTFELLFNGQNRTGTITLPNTGSWTTFTSHMVDNIDIRESDTLMRVNILSGEFNLGRFIFSKPSAVNINLIQNVTVYPTVANNIIKIKNIQNTCRYKIINSLGVVVQQGKANNNQAVDIQNLPVGLYLINIDNVSNQTLRFIKTR